MISKAALFLCVTSVGLHAAFGYSSDDSTLDRIPDRWTVRTNSEIVFTVSFTNAVTASLRGFYCTDQVSTGLTVKTLSVSIDGQSVTNYTFETGQEGDVYAGCIPYRWILEQPAGYSESNAIPAQGTVQIVYSLASAVPAIFAFQEFTWAAWNPDATNASFGYVEGSGQPSLTFLTGSPVAVLNLSFAANGLTLHLDSLPGCSYVLQASANGSQGWVPVVTNVAPFNFTESLPAALTQRYYRALWLP